MSRPETFSHGCPGNINNPELTLLSADESRYSIFQESSARNIGKAVFFGHCLATTTEKEQAVHQLAEGEVEAVTNLHGNYSGFISTDAKTIAFSGLSGQHPLYYYRRADKGITVSAQPSRLADAIGGVDIDRATLGAQIGLPLGLLSENYSLFEGVMKLEVGEMIHTSNVGQHPPVREVYETFATAPNGSLEEAALATRTALLDSLERRLLMNKLLYGEASHLTADLSGGMDSSTLAYLITLISGQPIDAFMQHRPGYWAGDLPYAALLGHPHPLINLHELKETDDELPFSVLSPNELPFNPDEPYRTASIYGRQSQRIRAVQDTHSTLHLTGTGGDALYLSEVFVADLLLRGEYSRFHEEATRLSRLALCSPEQYKQRAYNHARHNVAQAWHKLADVLADNAKRETFDVGWLPKLSRNLDWLTPEIRGLLQERAEAMAQETKSDLSIGDYRTIGQIRDSGDVQRHLMFLEGSRVHAPYLDHRVIRAALQCDAYTRTQPGRRFKPVLTDALKNLGLHRRLFKRRDKGDYSLFVSTGLQKAKADILSLLQDSRLAALGIINPKAVQDALFYHKTDGEGQALFEPFVATEIWLRQREERSGKYIEAPPFTTASSAPENLETAVTDRILATKTAPGDWLSCAAGPDGQMVLLHLVTGQYVALDTTEALILRALNDTDRPEEAVQRLAARYPQVSADVLRADTARTIQRMVRQGWLTQTPEKNGLPLILRSVFIDEWLPYDPIYEYTRLSRSFTSENEKDTQEPPTEAEKQVGRQMLDLACELRDKGLLATKIYLIEARAHITGAANNIYADRETAERFIYILQQLSREPAYETQVIACYELSLAAVLMAAQQDKLLYWTLGVIFEPQIVPHAWVETVERTHIETGYTGKSKVFQELLRV